MTSYLDLGNEKKKKEKKPIDLDFNTIPRFSTRHTLIELGTAVD